MIRPTSAVRPRTYGYSRRETNLWFPVRALWPPVVLILLVLTPVVVRVLWLAASGGGDAGW